MGLDAVEVVMAIEEAFGIQIADEEAEKTRTPRQLCELVARKVHALDSDVCLTQRAFYMLRRAIRRTNPVPRRQFRTNTPLDTLVATEDRRTNWEQLRKDIGAVAWPKLKLPKAVFVAANSALIVLWLVLTALSIKVVPTGAILIIIFSVILFMIGLTYAAFSVWLKPFETSLAGQTVGTLAEHLVASNPHLLRPASDEWTIERIRLCVRKIISEQLAINPDFDDDADFFKDLGMG